MWEVWAWDGRCIQGKLLKKYKKKESAIKYAKKHIEYEYMVPHGKVKGEFFLEDDERRAVGMIIKRP
jgi:hypothetical protein